MTESNKPTLLLVDDERSSLDVLMHILKPEHDLRIAKSGAAALKVAEEHRPDLILLDILMPDMDGYEILGRLKNSDRTRDIPVIFITGLSQAEDEEKAFNLGARDYIVKPFNNAIVRARVRTQLQIVKHIRTIERLGMIDALTDIPNRRSFDNHLLVEWRQAVRQKTSIALLMADADRFKLYNDTYGHPQGDLVLQTVARCIVGCLRRPTDLAARVGGEEFGVILPETDLAGAMQVAESIRSLVAATDIPCLHKDATTKITVSIGAAAMIPEADDTAEDFFARADAKLYEAKMRGRNTVRY